LRLFFFQKTQNAKEGKGSATQQKPNQHFSLLLLLMMMMVMMVMMLVMMMITLSHRWIVFSVSKQPRVIVLGHLHPHNKHL
jgi:bacteriorhodopsin